MKNKIALKKVTVNCPICRSEEYTLIATGIDFEYDTSGEHFSFVQCSGCNVFYLRDRPDLSELGRIYPETYLTYSFHKNSNLALTLRNTILEKSRHKAFAKMLPERGDVLDAGCGDPSFLEGLRRQGSKTINFWGNEINEKVLTDLESRGFKTISGLIEDVNMPDNSFDVIFMRNLIEHVANPREVLLMSAKLLKGGGSLVIQTPNVDSLSAKIFKKSHWFEYHFPRHWTLFDVKTFSQLAEECGLKVKNVKYRHSPYSWVISVHHFLKDKEYSRIIYNLFSLYNPFTMAFGSFVDIIQQIFTSTTSNMQIILSKPRRD
jgi:SAM-dependent methyltransferase